MADDAINFEKALDELNKIVNALEQGGLPLEESLSYFEKGIALTRDCQKALQTAEQRVQILIEKNNEAALEPFKSDETS